MDKRKYIIFCEDHYNPLTLVRSLGFDNLYPIIVLIGENPYLIPNSKYARNIFIFRNMKQGLEYILQNYGKDKEKDFIFSCSDNIESLLDENYDILKDRFYFFNAGAPSRVSMFMDKETILEAAADCGIDVPKSERVRRGTLPRTINYPVITKSISSTVGGWKSDVFICNNEQELKNAYSKIKSEIVLIEEYIKKKNELCLDGISFNGGEEVYMPYKANYIRFTDGAYGNYMTISLFNDENLRKNIQNLFKLTKFSGIFSIEFLITEDNQYKFLEINFRHSTWAISSRYGGANLPLLWIKSQLAGRLDIENVILKQEPFTAMAEIPDFNDHVRHGNLSFFKWLKDFHNCPCTYFYNNKDVKPFYMMLLIRGYRFLKRKLLKG